MPAASKSRSELTDDQLVELLDLLRHADSAELKLTVPAEHHRETIAALDMDPLNSQIRLVTFFDTPDLQLNEAGVVVRARRVQGRPDDSVVELRPVHPDRLPASLQASENLVTEVDAMPGGYVCSASLKATAGIKGTDRVAKGERAIRKLFSKEQRAFFAEHAPDGMELDDLNVLGPIFVLKLKFNPPELDSRKMVAEMWLYPDGARILELSTKCPPMQAFETATELRVFLYEKGIDLSGEQQTKTRTALDYFAEHL